MEYVNIYSTQFTLTLFLKIILKSNINTNFHYMKSFHSLFQIPSTINSPLCTFEHSSILSPNEKKKFLCVTVWRVTHSVKSRRRKEFRNR